MTQKKIYFAHCMADYGNARERLALGVIEEMFGADWTIVNPAEHQDDYQDWLTRLAVHKEHPMQFWTDLAKSCDAVAFLWSDVEGEHVVGAGVAQEILTAHVWEIPVFAIGIWRGEGCGLAATLSVSDVFSEVLSIDETRTFIAASKEDLPYDEEIPGDDSD